MTLSRVTIRRPAVWIYVSSGATALLCQPTIRAMIYELMSHLYQCHIQQLWFLNWGNVSILFRMWHRGMPFSVPH